MPHNSFYNLRFAVPPLEETIFVLFPAYMNSIGNKASSYVLVEELPIPHHQCRKITQDASTVGRDLGPHVSSALNQDIFVVIWVYLSRPWYALLQKKERPPNFLSEDVRLG